MCFCVGLSAFVFFSVSFVCFFFWCTCVGVRVSVPVFALSERVCVCLKNGDRCGRVGGGMGKTQRSAITLKHAGPYLCHEA